MSIRRRGRSTSRTRGSGVSIEVLLRIEHHRHRQQYHPRPRRRAHDRAHTSLPARSNNKTSAAPPTAASPSRAPRPQPHKRSSRPRLLDQDTRGAVGVASAEGTVNIEGAMVETYEGKGRRRRKRRTGVAAGALMLLLMTTGRGRVGRVGRRGRRNRVRSCWRTGVGSGSSRWLRRGFSTARVGGRGGSMSIDER